MNLGKENVPFCLNLEMIHQFIKKLCAHVSFDTFTKELSILKMKATRKILG